MPVKDPIQKTVDKVLLAKFMQGVFDTKSTKEELLEKAMTTKADEVMHLTNTGAGEEFIPSDTVRAQFIDLMPEKSSLMAQLPASHGTNMELTERVPVKALSRGEDTFSLASEWTDNDGSFANNSVIHTGATPQTTADITITQQRYEYKVNVSDRQLLYNYVDTMAYVREEIMRHYINTVEGAIINGDSEAGTTNVNFNGATPGGTEYFLGIDGGLRERMLNGGYSEDMSALGIEDFDAILKNLRRYGQKPGDVLFLCDPGTWHTARALDEFSLHQNTGDLLNLQNGLAPTPRGSMILSHQFVPLADSTGFVDGVTPANNTKGTLIGFNKKAIQYGFGQGLKIEVTRRPGYGWQFMATFEFGYKIVDAEDSQTTEPTVYGGYNITL